MTLCLCHQVIASGTTGEGGARLVGPAQGQEEATLCPYRHGAASAPPPLPSKQTWCPVRTHRSRRWVRSAAPIQVNRTSLVLRQTALSSHRRKKRPLWILRNWPRRFWRRLRATCGQWVVSSGLRQRVGQQEEAPLAVAPSVLQKRVRSADLTAVLVAELSLPQDPNPPPVLRRCRK